MSSSSSSSSMSNNPASPPSDDEEEREESRPLKRLRKKHYESSSDDDSDDNNDDNNNDGMDLEGIRAAERMNTNDVDARRNAPARRGPSMLNDSDSSESEEEEGEDLQETAVKDYRKIDELDRYDENVLDESEIDHISQEARRAAEKLMTERDDELLRGSVRVPGMLEDSDSGDSDTDDEAELRNRARRRRQELGSDDEGEGGDDDEEEPAPVDLLSFNESAIDIIEKPAVQAEVRRRFEEFLRSFREEGSDSLVYLKERITDMCRRNTQSLMVEYRHLSRMKPVVATWVADMPSQVLPLLDTVARKVTHTEFPNYRAIHEDIFVRIEGLPVHDSIRDLRTGHLNQLVNISGIVTRRSQVMPELASISFRCTECGLLGEKVTPDNAAAFYTCEECEDGGRMAIDPELSKYRNYQNILVQESPGTIPPGRVPRYKEVTLHDDLIDSARPGEEVEVIGIYSNSRDKYLNSQQSFPVFRTTIRAVNLTRKEDLGASVLITDEDKRKFTDLARDSRVVDRVIDSISPSIYGHRQIKTALALSMFGGHAKNIKNKHRIRGDINVLLMGDPGTAKSQCLKFVEKTAPRAVYTTGKGASAVGLTASVHKDHMTKEWVLEGGALVLADKGVCLIDEFDKMNDKDRTSIHEAMEQQSISISKAGIVTTLQARCAVIAAANPIDGRYDPQKSFLDNVELTDPIIQRFDILCILQDVIDGHKDELLAKFVVGSHVDSHPTVTPLSGEDQENEVEDGALTNTNNFGRLGMNPGNPHIIDQALLKKYILYARTLKPQLSHVDHKKIENLYVELRRQSAKSGGVPIAVRHMESILRMSEAFARMQLREYVRNDDVDRAIKVMLTSFIQSQKHSVKQNLQRVFRQYLPRDSDDFYTLKHILQEKLEEVQHLNQQNVKGCTCSEFERAAAEMNVHDCSAFYRSNVFLKDLNLEIVLNDNTGVKFIREKDHV